MMGCEDNQSDTADNEQAKDGQRRMSRFILTLSRAGQRVKQIGQEPYRNERQQNLAQ